MRFGLENITLWLRTGEQRTINFLPDKINVITGKSGTGKTAILDIFDYCFAASSHSISESIINESVDWYGIKFYIHDKHIVICRKSPVGSIVSTKYFLSTIGELPQIPFINTSEVDIKNLLQTEFGIESNVIAPFGGQAIRAGSKLSFRYFLLFSSLSQDIITNSNVFFDKQSQERYREALPRVFDLAMGIDDIPNILAREHLDLLEANLSKLEKRQRLSETRISKAAPELQKLATRAAAYGLAGEMLATDPIAMLQFIVDDSKKETSDLWQGEIDKISAKISEIDLKIRNANRFVNDYKRYKSSLKDTNDSLKPIEILADNEAFLVKSPAFAPVINALKISLSNVKQIIATRNPIDIQLQDILRTYAIERLILIQKQASLPPTPEAFLSEKDKWMFIGEVKGQLDAYSGQPETLSAPLTDEIEKLKQDISNLTVVDMIERRDLSIRTIEKNAQRLLDSVSGALENYAKYEAIFNYKEKKLQLRKPRSLSIENVGSSSNHMFLHLVHMLSLHELAISNTSRFVPSFLIIDQPSRPYYGDETATEKILNSSDNSKITYAMAMLNSFLKTMKDDYMADFQMIIFEHIPPNIWENMENFHLVEIFRDGNALIPGVKDVVKQ